MSSACLKRRSEIERERQREREAEQDGDGVQPRLELRREDEVHEDERQAEGDQEALRRAPHLFGSPDGRRRVAAREIQIGARILTSESVTALSD